MRIFNTLLFVLLLVIFAAGESAASSAILPDSFSGWNADSGKNHVPDAASAAALKEFGLQAGETRIYQRSGRTITATAYRFADATGAYGAFSYYRTPEMVAERLCDNAASAGTRVIFYCANLLLDVQLDKVTAMTMAELRSLAGALPKVSGPAAQSPNLALYLPDNLGKGALHFALGPAGYARSGSPVPAELIGFDRSPEIVVKDFRALDGTAQVTLILYPTPAIATQHVKKFEEWGQTQRPLAPGHSFETTVVRRSGPIVGVVTGDIAPAEARKVVENINFEADVNWTEPTFQHPRDNIGGLVYAAILLAIIIFGVTVAVGIVFGGFRIGLRKLFPNRFPDPAEEGDLIRLKLNG